MHVDTQTKESPQYVVELDKSRPMCLNAKNLAQAAPIDSFSYCSRSRIAVGRETIQDIGKNAR